MKLREGNVFRCVCMSTGEGGFVNRGAMKEWFCEGGSGKGRGCHERVGGSVKGGGFCDGQERCEV